MTGASDRLFLVVHGVAVPAPFLGGGSPPAVVPPGQPVGLAATPGVTTMLLAWSPPAAGGATGYRVTRDGTVVATPAASPWTDTSLTASSSHTWAVSAVGPGGVSATAATVTASTLATPPKPTPGNTGPTPGAVVTTYTGTYNLLADGVTLTGVHITGDLILRGSDALVVDCLVDGSVFTSAGSRQTLRRVKAKGLGNPGGFEAFTLDACFFGGDGINDTISQLVDSTSRAAHGFVVKNCYFYGRPTMDDPRNGDPNWDPHWECIHWVGITGMDITNNVFDYKAKPGAPTATADHITGCVVFQASWTGTNVVPSGVFSNNWISGGGRWLQSYLNLNGGSVVNNNDFDADGTGADPYTIAIPDPDFTASGNTRTAAGVTSPLAITY